jgi:hypothetical protein
MQKWECQIGLARSRGGSHAVRSRIVPGLDGLAPWRPPVLAAPAHLSLVLAKVEPEELIQVAFERSRDYLDETKDRPQKREQFKASLQGSHRMRFAI